MMFRIKTTFLFAGFMLSILSLFFLTPQTQVRFSRLLWAFAGLLLILYGVVYGECDASKPFFYLKKVYRYKNVCIFFGCLLILCVAFFTQIRSLYTECSYVIFGIIHAVISTIMVAISLFFHHLPKSPIRTAFHVAQEFNVSAVWASIQFFSIAIFIFYVLQGKKRISGEKIWYFVGGLTVFFGLDEFLSIHERTAKFYLYPLSQKIFPSFELSNPSYVWVFTYAPVMAITLFVIFVSLYKDFVHDKKSLIMLSLGGCVFLLGAVGMEINEILNNILTLHYRFFIEEYAEMIGLTLIGAGIMHFMQCKNGSTVSEVLHPKQ